MRKEIRHEIESRLYKYAQGQEDSKAWQAIIGAELEALTAHQTKLLNMRYGDRKSEREICQTLHIERSTYYSWITDIVQDIALLAAYYRMINPETRKGEKL